MLEATLHLLGSATDKRTTTRARTHVRTTRHRLTNVDLTCNMATADIVPLAGELSGNRETVGWLRVSVERSVIPDRVSRNERSELRGMLCPENGTKNVAGTARKIRSAINDNGPRRRRPDKQTRAGPSTAESSANNECHESGRQPAAQARVSRSGRPRCSKRDSRNLPL